MALLRSHKGKFVLAVVVLGTLLAWFSVRETGDSPAVPSDKQDNSASRARQATSKAAASFDFYLLAILVGTVQGGAQALSRSLFSTLIPAHKSAEFFAFFGVFDKFAGIFGPALFAITIAATGSSRNAVLSVIAFFVIGAILLSFVNVEEGRRVAREAEARLAPPP